MQHVKYKSAFSQKQSSGLFLTCHSPVNNGLSLFKYPRKVPFIESLFQTAHYASETVHRTVSEDRFNKDNVSLVGENSCFPPHPFSAFLIILLRAGAQSSRAPHGVTALRAEVSPDGYKGSALDLQGEPVPLDSR